MTPDIPAFKVFPTVLDDRMGEHLWNAADVAAQELFDDHIAAALTARNLKRVNELMSQRSMVRVAMYAWSNAILALSDGD